MVQLAPGDIGSQVLNWLINVTCGEEIDEVSGEEIDEVSVFLYQLSKATPLGSNTDQAAHWTAYGSGWVCEIDTQMTAGTKGSTQNRHYKISLHRHNLGC